jgi:hypothetical protein
MVKQVVGELGIDVFSADSDILCCRMSDTDVESIRQMWVGQAYTSSADFEQKKKGANFTETADLTD